MTTGLRTRSASGELSPRGSASVHRAGGGTGQVVSHVRELIERGALKPGDRLPAERDLATQIGVSRPTIRAGLRTLAAMGVVRSRHGSGTYIPEGPPALNTDALSFLAALHGFTREEMYEARRILEVGAAGLAAERATAEQVATLAEEVASLFAVDAGAAGLPGPRHQFPSRRGGCVGQPDCRLARRDGLGALLRAPARDRRRPRAIAICATRPRCIAGSTRPSARATPTRPGARCTITCSRPAGIRRRSLRPTRTLPRGGPYGLAGGSRSAVRRVARASGGPRRSDHTHETV